MPKLNLYPEMNAQIADLLLGCEDNGMLLYAGTYIKELERQLAEKESTATVPLTNIDLIRRMDAKQLANFIHASTDCDKCPVQICTAYGDCVVGFEAWLLEAAAQKEGMI